jgi:TolA-binding protein
LLLFIATFTAAPVAGKEKATPEEQSARLTEVGMDFDWAQLRRVADRDAAMLDVAAKLEALIKSGLPKERRSAAHFLSAEVHFLRGDYEETRKQFEKALKEDKKGPFSDDAAFGEIIALEALGKDAEAAKRWTDWEKQYPGSPLLPEALLAQAWNSLRRDSLHHTTRFLERLSSAYAHMEQDPRVARLSATVSYLGGYPSQALDELGTENQGVEATYLRALCREETGEMLEAAALYQTVVERHSDSQLRDYAMLAKANVFLNGNAYRSAADEFELVSKNAMIPGVRAEADLRRAICVFLTGDGEGGTNLLRDVTGHHAGTLIAARAQLLLGEVLVGQERYEEAILEFNKVLTNYFEHELAAGAQYSVGRCLDALGRSDQATSAYKLVVSGYPLAPQAPAAAYLAGSGLLEQGYPAAAAPYFQLVLDRYASDAGAATLVFASPDHQELVEASLCLLELSYHRTGNLGQLSGVPHMMLQRMPPSTSTWRAWALMIDADALAAQSRYDDAQQVLQKLLKEFPEHKVGVPANRLLAWTYAQQGQDELAIKTEERMLGRYAADGDPDNLSSAYLNKAHIFFNRKQYTEAARVYDEFLQRFSDHPKRQLALYQSGLCHLRLDHSGDAVDRWEEIVNLDPTAEIAERAWVRAGDVYFQTEHYDDAKRCYQGLLDHFANSRGAALGMLRMAQCDYNAGRDREALESFQMVVDRFPQTGIAREAERGMERALYRLGQRDDGGDILIELVERFPNSAFAADAQFEIAMRRYEAEEYSEAADAFRAVIARFPNYSAADRAHFLLADSYVRAGMERDARLAYEQFLTFFPNSEFAATVRFHLGSARFDEGDYMNAALDFMRVMEGGASDEVTQAALFNLALCKRMMDKNKEAQNLLERYRKEFPKDERATQVAYQMGTIHEKAGRVEPALEEYLLALNTEPDGLRTELYYRIGVLREHLGDNRGAIRAYRGAIKSPDKTDTFRLSAVARCASLYDKTQEISKAIALYRDLISNSTDPELVLAAQERASQLEAVVK